MEIIIFKERNERLNMSCRATVFGFAFFKIPSFVICGDLYV
jgi:hypothetical protein